ncbi:MAG: DUF1593 domain-containing protein [Bacteroidia bacterium]|nr:DUF1593 domain-containing protein [Bacteroidia bacterium]
MRIKLPDLQPKALLYAAGWAVLLAGPHQAAAQRPAEPVRPRIVVTADPELDDSNSLLRFLLYSSDLTVEGLIYASSQFHWKGDGRGTKWFVPGREYDRFGMEACPCESWRWAEGERFIHDAVEAYAQVYPSLKVHNPRYPAPEHLRSVIRYGNVEFDGDISRDSPGSDLIRSLMLDDRPGPLYLTAWGGHSTIARALKSVEEQYAGTLEWEAIRQKISRKVILLPSGDQDDTYAAYIRPHWPGIEYRQFRSGPNYGYGAQIGAPAENAPYLTPAWMQAHVTSRGPLGALYRVWGDGRQMVKGDRLDYFGLAGRSSEELKQMGYIVWMPVQAPGSWLGEGDNPTFMNMLGNGLRAYEAGSYGGWGGRTEADAPPANPFALPEGVTADSMASLFGAPERSAAGRPYPNFFPQAQRDFAARLLWSVSPRYADANHEPAVQVAGPLEMLAWPGQRVRLHGSASDPDGDAVSLRWWQFHTGTYHGQVEVRHASAPQAEVLIPQDAQPGQTVHLILEASDDGSPALTRYQRVVITVRGN